jgi:DSF synthase
MATICFYRRSYFSSISVFSCLYFFSLQLLFLDTNVVLRGRIPLSLKVPKFRICEGFNDGMNVTLPKNIRNSVPYRQLSTRYDSQHAALWCILDPKPRACFSLEVLTELRHFQSGVEQLLDGDDADREQVRYVILASKTPGVFNLGGDLALFIECVREKNRTKLREYALACINVLHPHAIGFRLPITTVSLVQGDALGGGLEAALASDVVIAERSAQMGFPEILFNLFPGMGAYNLLERRLGAAAAQKMILNGKVYTAEEFHALGLVDVLAEDGRGENALYEYIVRNSGKRIAHEAVLRVRRELNTLPYDQLVSVVDIWVASAMRLGTRELRLMDRLARAQDRLSPKEPVPFPRLRTEVSPDL